jgi:two-component system OmpR family response regulator
VANRTERSDRVEADCGADDMTNQSRILVVDDEARIRSLLRHFLLEEGFAVSEAFDGTTARAALERETFDLVLLDLMLPGEDGLSLARHIRQHSEMPIIMLTGKGDLIDRVVGLETGADDYIAKPFHLREVLARIRALMRRAAPRGQMPGAQMPGAQMPGAQMPGAQMPGGQTPVSRAASVEAGAADILTFEGWRLDLLRRELRGHDGTPVALTAGEFELLCAFAQHPNRVLKRDQLMDLVKGPHWAAYDRTIDSQIVRLRRKIETDPTNPSLIKTVRGSGYVFAVAPARP